MSLPPLGTLLVDHVPELGPGAVVGIDSQFFSVNNVFKGVKLIPKGLHFLHYSRTLDEGSAVRYGWWFHCDDHQVIAWNMQSESALASPTALHLQDLGRFYPYMVEYPEDRHRWAQLTSFLDLAAVHGYLASPESAVSTATPLLEENMVLLDVLRRRDPGQSFLHTHRDELRYTIVQTHVRRDAAPAADVTGDFLDRSWYLHKLFGHDVTILLAEVQLCFVHFLVLANMCSLTQWTALLALILRSRRFLDHHPDFCCSFLRVFEAQVALFPEEYMSPTLVLLIVDMPTYREILAGLQDAFAGVPAWHRIRALHETRFGIVVPEGSVFDAENFEVYDLGSYDPADEDAPALA